MFNLWFSFAPVFLWRCFKNWMSQRVVAVESSSLSHLGFVCDFFVIQVDSLKSSKIFTRTEQVNVSNHSESEDEV